MGTDDGNVHVSRDGGESWRNLNERIPDNPGYWVTRVVASHHDAGTAYLTFTGRHRADHRPFVYRTTNFGDSWESIARGSPSGIRERHPGRPQESRSALRRDRQVGVRVGECRTVVDLGRMKNNLPTIPVRDLVVHPRENDLVVGTFGRGFWITDISPLQELSESVLASDAHLFAAETRYQWVMPSQPAVSAQNFAGENEPYGVAVNYYLKDPVDAVQITIFDGTKAINQMTGPGTAGLNRVQWVMTERTPRSAEGIARWDRRFGPDADDDDEEFFDYYDTVEYYGEVDEEVSSNGLSRRTRVHDPGPAGKGMGAPARAAKRVHGCSFRRRPRTVGAGAHRGGPLVRRAVASQSRARRGPRGVAGGASATRERTAATSRPRRTRCRGLRACRRRRTNG